MFQYLPVGIIFVGVNIYFIQTKKKEQMTFSKYPEKKNTEI